MDAGQNDGVHSIFNACMFRKSCKAKDAEIERLRAAGNRLYAALGLALVGDLMRDELKDAWQAWIDAAGPN